VRSSRKPRGSPLATTWESYNRYKPQLMARWAELMALSAARAGCGALEHFLETTSFGSGAAKRLQEQLLPSERCGSS
jgi:hypothetical protein